MTIRSILEAKAQALASHDGVAATIMHFHAAANDVVLEARRELDSLVAGLQAPAVSAAPAVDQAEAAADPAELAAAEIEPEPAPDEAADEEPAPDVLAAARRRRKGEEEGAGK